MSDQTPMTPPEDAAATRRSSRSDGSAAVLREIAEYLSNSDFADDLRKAADEIERLKDSELMWAGSSPRWSAHGIEEHIDWKTQHDKREDLFQSDESSGLHFPCNACQHASKPASYCRACKHYAL